MLFWRRIEVSQTLFCDAELLDYRRAAIMNAFRPARGALRPRRYYLTA